MTVMEVVQDIRKLREELDAAYDQWLRRPDCSDDKLVKATVYLLAQEIGYWRQFQSEEWRRFPDALTSRVITNTIYLTVGMIHIAGSNSPEMHSMARAIVLDILLKHLMKIDSSKIEVVYKQEE